MKWIRWIAVTVVALSSSAVLAMPRGVDANEFGQGVPGARTLQTAGGGSGEVMGVVISSGKTPPIVVEIGKTSDEDRAFLFREAGRALADLKLGQLALKKGRSPAVRAEAERLLADARVNNQLTALGLRKGLPLPQGVPPDENAIRDRLARLSGEEFDRQFLVEVARRVNEMIRMFEEEAIAGIDPDLRTWASERLPSLRLHEELATAGRAVF